MRLTTPTNLRASIEEAFADRTLLTSDVHRTAIGMAMHSLDEGALRVATPPQTPGGEWIVNAWLKQAILLFFAMQKMERIEVGPFEFYDKIPLKKHLEAAGVRLVPPGVIRYGAFLERGAIVMPGYVNIGAYVGAETLIDSHALVGSCAQIGSRVHLSACAQIGGVLEPVGALPVIVEDDVLVGGNCGVYEGTILKRRVVLAAGSILTGSTPLYDVPNDRIIEAVPGEPLVVPEGAVVVPGTRPVTSGRGREWGLSIATPIIVKYRDERTSARTALESWIR